MNTNRIRFIDQNDSAYLSGGQTPVVGFTVIKAPRGTATPTLLPKGSEQAIRAMFGFPSKKYPDIQEAIEFNREYSLYVSAPPGVKTGLSNYYGGLYITTEGYIEEFYKVTDPEFPNFKAEIIATNNNSVFSNGTTKEDYAAQTITIDNIPNIYFDLNKVANINVSFPNPSNTTEQIDLSFSVDIGANEVVYNDGTTDYVVGNIVDNLDGTSKINLIGNSSVPSFDLTAAGTLDTYLTTPANYALFNVMWIYDIEDFVVQTIFQNSPRTAATSITIKKIDLLSAIEPGVSNPYYNTLTFSFSESDGFTSPDYIISTDVNAIGGFNQSLYVENVLDTKAKWYIGIKNYKQYYTISSTTNIPTTVVLNGTRLIEDLSYVANTDDEETLTEGWNQANDPTYEEVNLFFDNTGIEGLKTIFASLRAGVLKVSHFVSPIRVPNADTAEAITAIKLERASSPNSNGLSYIVNEFLVRDSQGQEYYSSIVGSVALNLARILDKKLGGIAPMYTNDASGLGGQLTRTVRKSKYKFTADQLDELDLAGVNPIILDKFYGLMLVSQKTAASVAFLSDWSFIGHALAFDLLKKEIKRDVLIPQLGKAISPYYLQLRQNQVESIVNKRLQGSTTIWTSAKVLVNDITVNNDETKMMNKFVIKVRIKVTPFTEYIDFVLNNVDQKTEI
jgi:hypothetical protein